MRNRIAALGVVLALSTVVVGATAVALALTTPEDSAPQAAASGAMTDAATAAYPTLEDHCYIEGMIPHHEQALELSRLVLGAPGVRERTRALADFIVADQTAEIDTMRAWQTAWRGAIPAEGSAGGHQGHDAAQAAAGTIPTGCGDHAHMQMKGMATAEQLAALDAADGVAADRMFLALMIAHHEGALEMAENAVREGSNAFVRNSGKHVLVEQQREVAAMTALLAEAS
ncbi:DUF305 domain-containing protein [Microbacterium trichothecenolyticum]|uniref:DUF305 domain-containing protein n=1 Tax=Microbacterium trichothecenolyticum TaxID=69370 RepID=A0A0M2HBQ3_MICTR|nr:DUF305 domain-containing protein [Microbacterium trichothecenolyticum]KJL41523.1 hypothetical protein RS82_02752 [Microbacterium trichothecenolyticum]